MKSVNTLVVVCLAAVFSGCHWEVSTDPAQQTTSDSQTDTACVADHWDSFCNSVRVQIYFTQEEILSSPIVLADISTRYRLGEFHAFLIGGTHAYSRQADDNGEFEFENIEPGTYTLLMRHMPARSSGIYFDCAWNLFDSHGNPLTTPICVKVQNAEPYYLGGREDGIAVSESQRVSVGLLHPQKLFINEGWQDSVQAVTRDNSAPIESVNPIKVGGI